MNLRNLAAMVAVAASVALSACTPEQTELEVSVEAPSVPAAGFAARPASQRIALVDPNNLTEEQAAMLAARADYNIYKTLANHTELYNRWSPLGQILLNNSGVELRHREMAMLRMGWLCQSEYEWAQHARIAHDNVGMSVAEVHAIAEGPAAEGWSDLDRAVLTMADDLRYDGMISDATWTALKASYSEAQITELMFTSAQYQLVSMALNSLGVQLDPELEFRLPDDLPQPALATRPTAPRLATPRIAPLTAATWNEEQAASLASRIRDDGSIMNLYATLATHPKLYEAWLGFMGYVLRDSKLPPRTRELLILRTGWNWNAEYEYAHHRPLAIEAGLTDAEVDRVIAGPTAEGWSTEDATILRAADELREQAFLTDPTWAALKQHYDDKQMVEIVYTVGGYAMTALAINSFGIQTEPGYTGYPAH